MNFLFPLGMAALAALLPLIVLYILKQKREETPVPTNFLWAHALEDLRASSLFQRLRTPLLLMLQALVVCLFGLAAAGASLNLQLGDDPRHVILMIDRSRSMMAADETGKKTRFEAALELASDAVDGLRRADEMMIVGFDEDAEVLTAFTGDGAKLKEVLSGLRARDMGSRGEQAMRLALAYAQASQGFQVEAILISDGAVADELPDVPFPVQWARVGKTGKNQGIAALQVSRMIGSRDQLFVRVDNGDLSPAERTVTLRVDGEVLDAKGVELPAEGTATVYFELPTFEELLTVEEEEGASPEEAAARAQKPKTLTVGLDGTDVLAADDSADMILRPLVPRTGILVAPDPSVYLTIENLESLHPGLAMTTLSPQEAETLIAQGGGGVDFACFLDWAPETLPPFPGQLYVNCIPPESGLVNTGVQEDPIIIDWHRTHPITNRCQFDDVIVSESMKLQGAERSLVLLESTGGPLITLTPVPGREVVVIAFPHERSMLPLRLAWPLLLANTLDFLLADVNREGEESVASTGTAIRLEDEGILEVTDPRGEVIKVEPDGQGKASFTGTTHAGVYLVSSDDRSEEPRAYTLLDDAEIRIAPPEQLVIGEAKEIAAVEGSLQRNFLLRDPLLILALGVLLLEWAIWCGRR